MVSRSTGVITLEEYSQLESDSAEYDHFRACGLSSDEIKLYQDYTKGIEYLEEAHKNLQKSALNEILQNVLEKVLKINGSKDNNALNRTPLEMENDEIKYSINPCFQIPMSSKNDFVPDTHPINNLHELEDDIFGHLDASNLPSLTKRRKILRRMERKFATDVLLPEPDRLLSSSKSKTSQEPPHDYDDFIKVKTKTSDISGTRYKPCRVKNPNSKWDIKDMKECKGVPKMLHVHSERKKIGCISQALYTIKDNKIVRLKPKERNDNLGKETLLSKFDTIELKVPVNKAEEKILEGTKLTIEDIKKLPKFQNYEPGNPTKVLFIKNLSNGIKEDDLISLFYAYESSAEIRLMTGKMKGQAFATFETPEIAARALNEKNGIILKGKPIILQYGKKGNG